MGGRRVKVYPIYDAKPLPKDQHRKNLLGLRRKEKEALNRFLEDNEVSPKHWLLDGWLSTRVKRVATLRVALFIAEWAQFRKGFHPMEVLTALAKYDTPHKPSLRQHPPNRDALRQILEPCRGLALDNDEDFETLLDTLADEIVNRELF